MGQGGRGRSSEYRGKADYNFSTEYDIKRIVMLEIQGATDLLRLKNSTSSPPLLPFVVADYLFLVVTRTGWDIDPFVVICFGNEIFCTRIIRHPLNPIWDEKLLFPVRE
jgi:phosphatidylserine decarboxylase